jgi:pimeloyl-ACP methyl ester carboxylesterase
MATKMIRGARLNYADSGKGLPLVLMHGFPLDLRMWNAQIMELATRWRVIAPDFRGFGQSESTDPFTTESLADDVHALLEEIRTLPCVLAGLSMGGYVALAYVRKYPGDLRGLILVDTKAAGDDAQGRENRNKMIELVRSKGSTAVADQMLPKMLAQDTPRNRPAQAQALRSMMEACPPRTIENALVALRDRPDQSETLPSIPVPTLIVVGGEDAITPVSVAESMQKQIPSSRLAVIKGAGHMSPMEQPPQVNQAISRFLGELR